MPPRAAVPYVALLNLRALSMLTLGGELGGNDELRITSGGAAALDEVRSPRPRTRAAHTRTRARARVHAARTHTHAARTHARPHARPHTLRVAAAAARAPSAAACSAEPGSR